ncbi:hypothetical protein [Pseudoalteromonas phage J2-1_QLiu-2017]|nr:hypothetical protein [Pseudoalteromonas phage J2-1_QLiu-2017]
MTVKVKELEKGCVKLVAKIAGEHLTSLDTQTGTIPAVYAASMLSGNGKKAPVIKDYPYALVEVGRVIPQGIMPLFDGFQKVNGIDKYLVEQDYSVPVSIRFYGNHVDSPEEAAQLFQQLAVSDWGQQFVEALFGPNVAIATVSDIVPTTSTGKDKFIDIRSMDINLNVKAITEINSDLIDTIDNLSAEDFNTDIL